MALQIGTQSISPGIVGLKLTGQLDGDTYKNLDQEISKLLEGTVKTIVLDMQGVDRISSAGIGSLVKAKATAKRKGGDLAMNNLQPQIKRVLEIMALVPTLNVFRDQAELDEYLTRVQQRILTGTEEY
jgi:anti-sigma B factor antagonist